MAAACGRCYWALPVMAMPCSFFSPIDQGTMTNWPWERAGGCHLQATLHLHAHTFARLAVNLFAELVIVVTMQLPTQCNGFARGHVDRTQASGKITEGFSKGGLCVSRSSCHTDLLLVSGEGSHGLLPAVWVSCTMGPSCNGPRNACSYHCQWQFATHMTALPWPWGSSTLT